MSEPERPTILIADDEPGLREVLSIGFRRAGFAVSTASGRKAAQTLVEEGLAPLHLVLTDLLMPDGSGLEVLAAAKKRSPSTEVIVMTAHSTVETAIAAMREGAYDFVVKPFSPAHVIAIAQKALERRNIFSENQRLRAKLERLEPQELELGTTPRMVAIAQLIDKIATTRTTVLITGESGTGKERIAQRLHQRSDRRDGPFHVVNCGALPEALMESELFGHEKGAFTGAASKVNGIFRDANGGTVLLDEIGELPLSLQVKLLRVLQERKVRPVGSSVEVPTDVRVLAATNRDVEGDVQAGRFRQDLYYRLNVIRIDLPPLRERVEDIPKLAERFVRRFAEEHGKEVRGVSPDALRCLERYAFPGNIRELENVIERAVALSTAPTLGIGDLPPEVSGLAGAPTPLVGTLPAEGCQLDEVLAEIERRFLLQALERTNGVRTAAAKLLGLTFRSFRYRLAKLGLEALKDEDEPPSSVPSSEP